MQILSFALKYFVNFMIYIRNFLNLKDLGLET